MPDAPRMAFKGGTSLSKVYKAISRFSEDVDITIDYRSLLPEFDPFDERLSNSQRRKGCDLLQERARALVRERLAPHFSERMMKEARGSGSVQVVDNDEALRMIYPSALSDAGESAYMQSSILMEFGGRNTTQPMESHQISPYVAQRTVDLFFPTVEASVLSGVRTFWEKATLIHVECNRDDFESRVARKSRHWYDLAKLTDNAIGKRALSDLPLVADVVKHKKVFFASAHARYDDCLQGQMRLVPEEKSRQALRRDFEAMIESGMFELPPDPMDEILARLSALEDQINQAHRGK